MEQPSKFESDQHWLMAVIWLMWLFRLKLNNACNDMHWQEDMAEMLGCGHQIQKEIGQLVRKSQWNYPCTQIRATSIGNLGSSKKYDCNKVLYSLLIPRIVPPKCWTRSSWMELSMLEEIVLDEAANAERGRQCWTRTLRMRLPMLDKATLKLDKYLRGAKQKSIVISKTWSHEWIWIGLWSENDSWKHQINRGGQPQIAHDHLFSNAYIVPSFTRLHCQTTLSNSGLLCPMSDDFVRCWTTLSDARRLCPMSDNFV